MQCVEAAEQPPSQVEASTRMPALQARACVCGEGGKPRGGGGGGGLTSTRLPSSRSLCHDSQPPHLAMTRPRPQATGFTMRSVRAPEPSTPPCSLSRGLKHHCSWMQEPKIYTLHTTADCGAHRLPQHWCTNLAWAHARPGRGRPTCPAAVEGTQHCTEEMPRNGLFSVETRNVHACSLSPAYAGFD